MKTNLVNIRINNLGFTLYILVSNNILTEIVVLLLLLRQ